VEQNFQELLETNRRLDSSINRHEATGTTHYERDSPVGICNARFSFRGSDVSCRSTVHRISINEQCVYTGCRKDCRNAALRSLDFTSSPASRACFWPSGSWADRLLVRQVVMSVKFGGKPIEFENGNAVIAVKLAPAIVAFSVRRLGQDPAAGDPTAEVQFPWKRSRRSRLAC
jgi:hypothetical protein